MAISLRVDKNFTYRGAAERFSNKYHLTGGNPGSNAEWDAITNALVAAEKAIFPSGTTIVFAAGYTSDTGAAVYTRDYTVAPDTPVPGTFVPGTGIPAPGDTSAWIRWWCGQYNTRGKKIYLRKYYHAVYLAGTGGDQLFSTQKTAYTTLANLLMGGLTVAGYSGRSICDKNGNSATTMNVVNYVTTRTLKRRSGSPL